jgi:glutaredoxin
MKQPRCVMRWSLIFGLLIAGAAQAQLYRWTDEKGRVHITDTPPPGSAKRAQKIKPPAATGAAAEQLPFETTRAMQDFPVTLYTFAGCGEPCARAREALNKRGVPFKEIDVSDEAKVEELKKVSGSAEAPTLLVGYSVQKGFDQSAYDALLDAARYPKAGTVPARNQQKPKAEDPEKTNAASAEPAEAPRAAGPYSPKPGPGEPKVDGPYAPIPGKDEPSGPGPYAPSSRR